jgi:uncharacterized protein YukE
VGVPQERGRWRPEADEDALRAAAGHWEAVADAVEKVAASGATAARRVQRASRGDTGAAFAAFWARYDSGSGAFLPATALACRRQAAGLRHYADAVAQAKAQVAAMAARSGPTRAEAAAIRIEAEFTSAVAGIVEATMNDDVLGTVAAISADATVASGPVRSQFDGQQVRLADKDGLGPGSAGGVFGGAARAARAVRLNRLAAERGWGPADVHEPGGLTP